MCVIAWLQGQFALLADPCKQCIQTVLERPLRTPARRLGHRRGISVRRSVRRRRRWRRSCEPAHGWWSRCRLIKSGYDVTHAADWDAVLRLFRPSQIVHLAAETGTGQSLSHATRHASVNVVGTAQLLDALSPSALVPDQLVLASSRAVYGEGAWRCGTQTFYPRPRSHAQLLAGVWDPSGHQTGRRPAAR